MNWRPHAQALAEDVTHHTSRWRAPVAGTPRHLFVPRWWERTDDGWALQAPHDEGRWYSSTYRDTSLVTRVGPHHADHAKADDHPAGRPTSSATLPTLVVNMMRHAYLEDGDQLLYVGTGTGYGTALAARRLHPEQVTSVDVDPYLAETARERLESIGLNPRVETADATGPLPVAAESTDRIVSTVSVRTIPKSWLTALCRGGRLVTTIAGTSLLVTADKEDDGGATGRVLWDRAGFMSVRHGKDYPPELAPSLLAIARDQEGEETTTGPYPVVQVTEAWDLDSMLSLTAPGIVHEYREHDGQRTAIMAHPDGSWARATAEGTDRPTVHQGGPRRLWDILDAIRHDWLATGELPVRGARVFISPDGRTVIARGKWHSKL